MWSATVDGRPLRFHLAGINNENFIMRDDETGSWWQQISGEAFQGPLTGRSLEPVSADDVSFDIWRAENAGGRVLVPDDSVPWKRFSEDWEVKTAEYPVVGPNAVTMEIEPRAIVIGIRAGGEAKAYALDRIVQDRLIIDTVGGTPVAVVLGSDGRSVRVFDRRLAGVLVEHPEFNDSRLTRLYAIKDYWFDWKTYNSATTLMK